MSETSSSFVRIEARPEGGAIASVQCEKVAEREARILEQEILESAPDRAWRIVVDLAQVTLLSSSGLGMLMNLNRRFREQSGRLVICGLNDDIRQVLKLTRLDAVLKLAPDRAAAEKAIDK